MFVIADFWSFRLRVVSQCSLLRPSRPPQTSLVPFQSRSIVLKDSAAFATYVKTETSKIVNNLHKTFDSSVQGGETKLKKVDREQK